MTVFSRLILDVPGHCGNPGVPRFGELVGDDFSVGVQVSYVCKEGYRLLGNVVRRCGRNGRWSGDLPVCQSK